MKKTLTIALLSLVLLSLTIGNAQVKAQNNIPLLGVVKNVESTTVKVNEPFIVYIEITNFGNDTAYDVTLTDEYPSWTFEIIDKGATYWPQIQPNETVYTFFKIKITNYVTPIMDLGQAKVTYKDKDGNKYTVFSDNVKVVLLYYESTNIDVKSTWRDVSIGLGLVLLFIVVPLLLLEYRFYKKYKAEMMQ